MKEKGTSFFRPFGRKMLILFVIFFALSVKTITIRSK